MCGSRGRRSEESRPTPPAQKKKIKFGLQNYRKYSPPPENKFLDPHMCKFPRPSILNLINIQVKMLEVNNVYCQI